MTISISQVHNQISQILGLRDKFVDLSKQSDDRLTSIIETTKAFRSEMEPLNKAVAQLQTRVQNLERCIDGLSHVQDFYKTGREVEGIISKGPDLSTLSNYLIAMDRIRDSLNYFEKNNTEHVEYSRLGALFVNGIKILQKLHGEILQQINVSILPEKLYQLVENHETGGIFESDTIESMIQFDRIPEQIVTNLQLLSSWLRKVDRYNVNNRSEVGDNLQLPDVLCRYCDLRRDIMRRNMVILREYQQNQDRELQALRTRVGSSNQYLNLTPVNRKRGALKAVGVIWDVNTRRGLVDQHGEIEDLDSEHYATSLSAFIVLFEVERCLLDRLKLTINSHESHFAYYSICKAAANALLAEGGTLTRLMSRAQHRGEFYMIISLLTVLKRAVILSKQYVTNLKILTPISGPFNEMISHIRGQTKITLDGFIQCLSPTAGNSLVPPDATVHELASNALLFLEKLKTFTFVVEMVLIWDPTKVNIENTFEYLATIQLTELNAKKLFGGYIFNVITAVIANIDKKSDGYSDDLSKLIFQMNNLCYLLKTLADTQLNEILFLFDNSAYKKFSLLLDERRQLYTGWCLRTLFLPNVNFISQLEQRKQMDSRERSQLKELWTNLNQGLASFVKQHSQLSIPDKDLRKSLGECLSNELVPIYNSFREKSLSIPFTSRREKYIKLTTSEFQGRLLQPFGGLEKRL